MVAVAPETSARVTRRAGNILMPRPSTCFERAHRVRDISRTSLAKLAALAASSLRSSPRLSFLKFESYQAALSSL